MKCKICESETKIKYRRLFDNRHGYNGRFDIEECTHCGFMQTRPQLSLHSLSKIYTNNYPKRDADIKGLIESAKHLPSKKDLYRQGNITDCYYFAKKGQDVLDIGCGTCFSLLVIKKLGGRAWGIDPDKNSQNVANKLKLKFHCGTIHNCKFPQKSFDLITAAQVLEHEPDPIGFLINAKKFLKKDGKIILSFPNTDALYRRIWKRYWLHWHVPYHLNHFNNKSVYILAHKAGLKITSIKTATPNLWTILQFRSFINKPKMGERDVMWDGGVQTNGKGKSFVKKFFNHTLPILNKLIFINRIIDRLGLGESFLVELKPVL